MAHLLSGTIRRLRSRRAWMAASLFVLPMMNILRDAHQRQTAKTYLEARKKPNIS